MRRRCWCRRCGDCTITALLRGWMRSLRKGVRDDDAWMAADCEGFDSKVHHVGIQCLSFCLISKVFLTMTLG